MTCVITPAASSTAGRPAPSAFEKAPAAPAPRRRGSAARSSAMSTPHTSAQPQLRTTHPAPEKSSVKSRSPSHASNGEVVCTGPRGEVFGERRDGRRPRSPARPGPGTCRSARRPSGRHKFEQVSASLLTKARIRSASLPQRTSTKLPSSSQCRISAPSLVEERDAQGVAGLHRRVGHGLLMAARRRAALRCESCVLDMK